MIQKTLTITVVEKDEVTGEPHYNVRLYRGPSAGKLIIEPLIQGKFVVDEADLIQASRELKEFYSSEEKEEPKKESPRRIAQDRAKSKAPLIAPIPDNIPNTKYKPTLSETQLVVEYGEDND